MGHRRRDGRKFENRVHNELKSLERLYPDRIVVEYQPELDFNGRIFIPDFRFEVDEHHQVTRRYIECQNRNRTTNELIDKFRTIREKGRLNSMMFVHGGNVQSDRRALFEKEGIDVMTIQALKSFLGRLSATLHALPPPDTLRIPGATRRRTPEKIQDDADNVISSLASPVFSAARPISAPASPPTLDVLSPDFQRRFLEYRLEQLQSDSGNSAEIEKIQKLLNDGKLDLEYPAYKGPTIISTSEHSDPSAAASPSFDWRRK